MFLFKYFPWTKVQWDFQKKWTNIIQKCEVWLYKVGVFYILLLRIMTCPLDLYRYEKIKKKKGRNGKFE